MNKVFVGVDISKDHLDIAIAGERNAFRIANSQAEILACLQGLKERIALLAFEPTGGHERLLRRLLRETSCTTTADQERSRSLPSCAKSWSPSMPSRVRTSLGA